MTEEEAREAVEAVLENVVRPALARDPRLADVNISIDRIDVERGIIWLNMELSEGLGCSPFCGCAANQLAAAVEGALVQRLDWVRRVLGRAAIEPGNPGDQTSTER